MCGHAQIGKLHELLAQKQTTTTLCPSDIVLGCSWRARAAGGLFRYAWIKQIQIFSQVYQHLHGAMYNELVPAMLGACWPESAVP